MARNEPAAAPAAHLVGVLDAATASVACGWTDPLDAYRRLRAMGRRPVLLEGAGEHPEARRSFVACDPAFALRVQDGRCAVRGAGEVDWTGLPDPPLDALRRLMDTVARVPPPRPAGPAAADAAGTGFTGGLVGFFGYEAARLFEPTLPPPVAPAATPDVLLLLCPVAVAFDRREGTVTVHAADLAGDADAARRVAEATAAALAHAAASSTPRRGAHEAAAASDAGDTVADVGTGWTTSLDRAAFEDAVARWKGLIAAGDMFQANLATRFAAPVAADPADLFASLRAANPSPFMALLEWDGAAIVSGSPEQLFVIEGRRIASRPIAGTRPRGLGAEQDAAHEADLLADAKEDAEHTMLVDLVRNDVARVAVPGSVRVTERRSVERYRHVMHLVSRVEGDLRPGAGALDALAALFPGGTITGAPKHRACLRIGEAEPVPRGPYTGSLGYVGWGGDAQFNILIRTLVLGNGTAHVHAGSGIVADSVPAREWDEAQRKARALLEAATGRSPSGPRDRLGAVRRHGTWSPPAPPSRVEGRRVLLVDNYDSFVWNLADYCAALGAEVRVVRNDDDVQRATAQFAPTHVILGPGPGRPEEAGATPLLAAGREGLPTLGVCLGHQAIGAAFGGAVVQQAPVHGKTSLVHHAGAGLLAGLPSPLVAARYHSLVVDEAGLRDVAVDARLEDGTVMALRHLRLPLYGVQFHPESLASEHGMAILLRFLSAA